MCVLFSTVALDRSTDKTDNAQLAIFVHGVDCNFDVQVAHK